MKTRLSKEERQALKQKVFDALLVQPIFQEFKYIKSQGGIVHKTKFGFQRVAMYFHWDSYNRERQEFAFKIMHIGYGIRFNVLKKWFEKFSFKTLKDQRDNYVLGRTARMLKPFSVYPDSYTFLYSGEDFDENLAKMVKEITEVATYFFEKYRTIENIYKDLVVPILEGKSDLPDKGAGVDWIFEYLTISRLVDIGNYEKLKQILLKHIVFLNEPPYPNPNIVQYNDKLDEIFEYLEVLELEMPPAFPSLLENNVKENEDIYNAIDDEESEQSKILNDIEYIDCSQNKNSNLQKEYDNYFSQFDEEYITNIMRECCKKFNSGINKDKITWSDFYNCMREYALDFLEYDEGLIDQIDELLITEEDDF